MDKHELRGVWGGGAGGDGLKYGKEGGERKHAGRSNKTNPTATHAHYPHALTSLSPHISPNEDVLPGCYHYAMIEQKHQIIVPALPRNE